MLPLKNIICYFILLGIFIFTNLQAKTIDEIQLNFSGSTCPPNTIITHPKIQMPQIGLALSGGGMRGIAQLGVIEILDANNIPINYIVGTSIGAVIASLYASGYSTAEIFQLTRTIDWNSLLKDEAERSSLFLADKQKRNRSIVKFQMNNLKPVIPEAITPGQKVTEIFTNILFNAPIRSNDFSKLKIPIKIISTDLLTGNKVMLTHGDLSTCVRSSISIPLLFRPVEMDSLLLIDGGISRNIPVSETRECDMDYVIAVDATSPLRNREQIHLPWEVADQVTTIMQQEADKQQCEAADIVISLEDIYSINTNFDALEMLYQAGKDKTLERLDDIKKLVTPQNNDDTSYNIRFLIQSNTSIPLHLEIPGKVTRQQIYNELVRLYENGNFKNIYANINIAATDTILEIKAEKNPVLGSVQFIGNVVIPDDSLQKPLESLIGKPINQKKSQKAILNILEMYREHGYSLATIQNIKYDTLSNHATFYINEGEIHHIYYSGLKKTKRWVINRESRLRAGQIFKYNNLQKTINNIYATDLFSNIQTEVIPIENQYDIKLHFSEKQADIIRLGARYDQERHGKMFVEYADENILGTGNDVAFHALYGNRDLHFYSDYRMDQILQTFMTAHANFHYEQSEHFSYLDTQRTGEYKRTTSGLTLEIGRQLERFGSLTGQMKLESIDIDKLSGSGYSYGNMKATTFGIKSVIDTRDNLPFPNFGKYHIFYYTVTNGEIFGNWKSFFHVFNQLSVYSTFWNRHTFSPKIAWGTADPNTPYSEQFKMGGQNSFYGLRDEQLTGIHLFQTSLNYRYKLPSVFKMNAFFSARYDLGGVWKTIEDITPENFLSGYGVAMMFKTFAGPLQFDYGWTNTGLKQFYFSAGFDF